MILGCSKKYPGIRRLTKESYKTIEPTFSLSFFEWACPKYCTYVVVFQIRFALFSFHLTVKDVQLTASYLFNLTCWSHVATPLRPKSISKTIFIGSKGDFRKRSICILLSTCRNVREFVQVKYMFFQRAVAAECFKLLLIFRGRIAIKHPKHKLWKTQSIGTWKYRNVKQVKS